jgi:hypothetical protein
MPTEVAIVITGIVLVFAAFAAALGWAAYYTRNVRAGRNLFRRGFRK